MEELAEGALKGILRIASIVVRSLLWLIWDLFFEILAWFVGWPICRAVSIGHYPKEGIMEHEQVSTFNHFIVSLVGLLSLVGLGILLAPWE